MKKLLLIFIIGSYFAQAQSLYNKNYTLSIGANTTLFVADSIINNGTIINNGDIQVGGIWQNNATYEPGTGQLTLTSNQTQTINHNDQSFTRLTISGGGKKIFGADITIEDELVLNDGILSSSGTSKIIIEEGAAISGGSETSFIEGPLYHTGTGDKYYPVGADNVYLPVELLDIKGTNPTIGVLINMPNTNLKTAGDLEAVTDRQNWQLDVLNGMFAGAGVVLPLQDELFLDNITEAVVVQASSQNEGYYSLGGMERTGDVLAGSVTSETDATELFLTIGKFTTEPGSEINVYNALSPNGDGINDFFKIENIELYPNNVVLIYTRWGDKVFEQAGYDNVENTFTGKSNVGKIRQLLEGTYYYVVEKGEGSKNENGFIVIRY